ncbi:DUF6527 family protein [Nitratidesulfovibrio liaohensis]|uniref:Ammonia monooxygenase n=1 Tax=Nitratidesulfovibrio liaohensis TaxID=2604158 RepID=A0ABY9QXY9_9BACT|nr:DUF6527 family protein [Nitratidesulfovibrio liaohensis]WMW64400.1 hypothetical protein KPS_002412 [Nitratidesulfovibrio liaohensis]
MSVPISSKLAWVDPDRYMMRFWCPGCQTHHIITVRSDIPAWSWNGDGDYPTFSPSILVRHEAKPDAGEGFEEWRKERVCHCFVRDGRIQFLSDCTHHLAGQTVELPALP